MKYLLSTLLLLLSAGSLFAQDSAAVANDVTVLYRKEQSGGITVHGNGLGLLYRNARHATVWKKRVWEIEFVSMRHPKQYKVTNELTTADAKPFFYGKLNYVYLPRFGYGFQRVIFGKAERSGVEVRYNLFAGVDLAITKPVYNDILVDDPTIDNQSYKIIVTKRYDPNDPEQQDISDFYGPGNYFSGFDQLKLYPGAYGKFSISFEYSTVHQKVAIIETGMVADGFLKEIPIMAYIKNNQYFFNFYVSLMWGGKKN